MKGKKALLILTLPFILAAILAPLSANAQQLNPNGTVYLTWRYPNGLNYYPTGTSSFTLDINSPAAWTNTSKGIIAYAFTVTTNSSFMKPIGVTGAQSGYWLYDFVNKYVTINPGNYYPLIAKGSINSTTIPNLAEGLAQWSTLGAGAGGSSNSDANGLITMNYQILNEYNYTWRPTGEGTQTGWTATPKGTTKVTDVSDQNDLTGINASKGSKEELFTYTEPSNVNGTILSVNFYMRGYYNGTKSTSVYPLFYFPQSGDTLTGSSQALTSTDTTYSFAYAQNPDTSAAWTWSDLSDLQYGVESATAGSAKAGSIVTDLWMVITYIPHPWDTTFMPIKLSASAYYTVQGGTSSVWSFNSVPTGCYNVYQQVPEFPLGPTTAVEIGLIIAVVYVFLTRRKVKPTVPKRFINKPISQ
jgi:hypothetical protein